MKLSIPIIKATADIFDGESEDGFDWSKAGRA